MLPLQTIRNTYLLEPDHPRQWVQDDLQKIHDELFYRKKDLRILSPESVQKVIYWNHDSAMAGHPGIKKTLGNCEK